MNSGPAASAQINVFLESAPDAIVVVDAEGRMVKVNRLTELMFGFDRAELLGNKVEMLVPPRYRHSHVRHREQYSALPKTRPMGMGRSLTGIKKDGSEFPIEISLSPFQNDQGSLVISIIRDITERRRAEELIEASLREKEVLLKEIHHRVKNNLQITSSLLKLQSGYIQDGRAREMFADSQNRIRSMALVHEKLYQSSDLSRIHFADYIGSLATLLFRTYGVDQQRIHLHCGGEGIFLSVETAVPCGLIVNELLSNCLKHAFPADRSGEIWIQLVAQGEGFLQLTVADNGVGLPEGLDLVHVDTLGLQLVRTLAQQLDGAFEAVRSPRTEFKITFRDSRPETHPPYHEPNKNPGC
jgi:two-component system, sensor histidine kinase PdtaS